MKAKSILPLILGSLAFSVGAGGIFAETPPVLGRAAVPAEARAKNPEGWPVLTAGTSAEEILRVVGKPDAVRPMESPDGKAEVWVYRRLARHTSRQTAATAEVISAFSGIGDSGGGNIGVAVPSFRMEHVKVYQVSSLLMFDGKLVTGSQKVETERRFE